MLYIKRSKSGQIIAISCSEEAQQGWEICPDDDLEAMAFLNALNFEGTLAATDLGLARVVEDLIDLLIEKDALRFTDLPVPAQEKLLKRRNLRASLNSLHLLSDKEEDGLI